MRTSPQPFGMRICPGSGQKAIFDHPTFDHEAYYGVCPICDKMIELQSNFRQDEHHRGLYHGEYILTYHEMDEDNDV